MLIPGSPLSRMLFLLAQISEQKAQNPQPSLTFTASHRYYEFWRGNFWADLNQNKEKLT